MARFIDDGVIQLHYVATIADPDNPDLSEIQAGTELTGFLIELTTPFDGSIVPTPAADTKFNETVAGTYGGQAVTATFYRDKTTDGSAGTDTAFDTLPRSTGGYFVIARFGGSGALGVLAAGDTVDVWPILVASRENMPYARNEPRRFKITAGVPDEPSEDTTVGSS